MKLTVLLLLAVCFQVSAKVEAQTVTYSAKNVSLERALNEVTKQTGYEVLYNSYIVGKTGKLSLSFNRTPLRQALDIMFQDKPLAYSIVGDIIVIREKEKVESQNLKSTVLRLIEIQGTVLDARTGKPLIGVTVRVKDSNIGTITDANGSFTLNVSGNVVLEISDIGYTSKEVSVSRQSVIKIELEPSSTSLNQLVVVGYGTQQKKNLTGAVSVVDVNNIKAQPAASVTEALQGKAAGVNIVNDGSPGSTPQINIRGYSTINNNNPLYIIDGVPYEGNVSWLNQDDIESLQVLKDASSASIYGSRASNGVVIITTKQGTKGPLKITFDASYGSSVPIRSRFPHFLTPIQYAQYLWQSFKNAGLDPGNSVGVMYGSGAEPKLPTYLIAGNAVGMEVTTEEANPSNYNHDPKNFYQITKANQQGTDWMRVITRNAPVQNYQIGASGGDEHAVYSFSLGYLNQQGIVKYTNFRRYTLRSNIEFNAFNNHLKFGENVVFSRTEGVGFATNVNSPGGYQQVYDPVADAYKIQPIIPVYDIMGNFAGARGATLGDAKNPMALLYRGKDNYAHTNMLFGNVYGEVDFLKDFSVRTSFGTNLSNYNSQVISYPSMEDAASVSSNRYSATQGYGIQWTWANTIKYAHTFNNFHRLSVLVGSEADYNSSRNLTGSRQGYFILGNQNYYYLSSGSSNIQNAETGDLSTLFSLFGRLDYSFKDKYLFNATIRRDGSSKFGPLNKYGIFPSFSAGWRISSEQFMKNIDWINDLKVRFGYGETGNQNIPSNNAFDLYTPAVPTSSYPMTGNSGALISGVYQNQIGNPSLEWERLKAGNIGVDFTLFSEAFDGTIDLYRRVTSGMLFPVPLPSQAAGLANSPFQNVGSMLNKGIEVSLNYHYGRKNNSPFKWDIGLNWAHNENRILELAPGVTQVLYGTNADELVTTVLEAGQPYGEFFGYKQDGIFQNEQEAQASTQPGARVGGMKYALINGDTAFSANDRTTLGSPLPIFTYGISLDASYKHFDISIFFYGSQGNKLYNETKLFTDFQEFPSAASTRLLQVWSPANPNSKIPSPSQLATPLEYQSSSYYVENGSYFRLKNLQIGYTFPNIFHRISSIRIYGSISNLFTITKYSGMDPEVSQYNADTPVGLPGVDLGIYPVPRQYLLGVNVQF